MVSTQAKRAFRKRSSEEILGSLKERSVFFPCFLSSGIFLQSSKWLSFAK